MEVQKMKVHELHMIITKVDLMVLQKRNQLRCGFAEIIPLEIHLKAQVHTAISLMEEIPLMQLHRVYLIKMTYDNQ